MSHAQIPRPKQDPISPPVSLKSPHVSQSSLLDSPIAQLLGFGTSSSQNISLPQFPSINNNNKNKTESIPSSNSINCFNNQPTFSETNENKSDETKNINIRLHNFQPPPLLLPKQNLLQPQFIESPRTKNQEEFLEDFEFYPEESYGMNFNNSINKTNSSFNYSNLNSSPSPRTSTFERTHATFDIVNDSQNSTNANGIGNPSINRFSSSPTFSKNGINRNSNKNMINLNLLSSPKLKPYMSSPFSTQSQTINTNSTFSNKGYTTDDEMSTKPNILSETASPSPKTPTFNLSSFNDDDDDFNERKNDVSIDVQKIENSKSTSDFDSNKAFLVDDIYASSPKSRNNNAGLPPIFTNASRSMLKIESDISSLKNSLIEVQDKYKRKYKSEKEKCRKEIISMIQRHREEISNYNENKNDNFFNNQPNLFTSAKSSSRSRNRFRNSNRRIRHDDSNYDSSDSPSIFQKKQSIAPPVQNTFNIDSIIIGKDSNKVLNCIGTSPPPLSNKDNVFSLPSNLKVSRASGQPTLHQQSQPESVIRVRVQIPNKKEFMHLDDPKLVALIKRQREEIIALNEETSLRLASIIEEGSNAEKQINDRIAELSASKNGSNYPNFVSFSDASSSSSSAPNAFCIEESDGSTKDEFNVNPASLLQQQTTTTSKYSSSSSSLSSSSLSSASNFKINTNISQQNESKNQNNKTSMIPTYGKARNNPQRLLRNIPH